MTAKIKCMVADEERIIDMDVFIDAHQELADYYYDKGLRDHALDVAIVTELPRRLAMILDGTTYH
jgi:hypothetical protein